MKKIALFLCAIVCLGFFTALPAAAQLSANIVEFADGEDTLTPNVNAADILINGGMEFDNENIVSGWGVSSDQVVDGVKQNFIGSTAVFRQTADKHSGKYSMCLTSPADKNTDGKESNTYLRQDVPVTPNVTYEFSAWMKSLNTTSGHIRFHGMFKDASGNNAAFKRMNLVFQNPKATPSVTLPANTWTRKGLRFTVPEGATTLTVYLEIYGKGSILLDDVLILARKEAIPAPEVDEKRQPVLTEDSTTFGPVYVLGSKGNFESYSNNYYINKSGNPSGHNSMVSTAYNHTNGGTKSLWMKNEINSSHGDYQPDFNFNKVSLVPGATYQISTWILAPETGTRADFSYWIDFKTSKGTDQAKIHYSIPHFGWWREYTFDFTVPNDTAMVETRVAIRLMNDTMQYYVDDMSLYMIDKPTYVDMQTDEMFYYSEWATGICSGSQNAAFKNAVTGGKIVYTFLGQDKTTALDTKTVSLANGKADYEFQTSLMAEKGKEYFISAKVYNASGTLLQEEMHSVYRFDRPTYMNADGIFRKNGKEYNLNMGTNVTMELLEADPREGGIQIVRLVADDTTLEAKMDKAHKMGLLCLVGLYGKVNGGDESVIQNTIDTVNSVKDHPALFGYQVQDEPYQKGNDPADLARAYVTIRNLDPHHVVYLVDSVPGGFEYLFRYADVVDIDYYGGSNPDSGRKISEVLAYAKEASKGRKPFTLMQQAFQYMGYRPTISEMRNIAYQAFFFGVSGISYHALGYDGSDGITTPYMYMDDWQEFCQTWAPWEQDFLYDCFVNLKYPLLRSYQDNNVMWRTYGVDNKIYLIIFNRQKNASTSVSVPLTSADGTALVNNFTAKRVAGGNVTEISGSGTLSLTLGGIIARNNQMELVQINGLAAEIWEITPDTNLISYAALVDEAFDDTADASVYKTDLDRGVRLEQDPVDSSNSVLYAQAHDSAISLLPVNTSTYTPASPSMLFAKNEVCKITYRIYVPTQANISAGSTFKVGVRYTDAGGNMAHTFISFSADDVNKWHNMEFYVNGFTDTPKGLYQEFDKPLACYIDDLKIERVKGNGYISDLNATAVSAVSKTNIWIYAATGQKNAIISTTDVVRPVICFVPSSTAEKALATVAIYKNGNGTRTLIQVKTAELGRTPLVNLQGATDGKAIGITKDELEIDISKLELGAGEYTVEYFLWNANTISSVVPKSVITVQ